VDNGLLDFRTKGYLVTDRDRLGYCFQFRFGFLLIFGFDLEFQLRLREKLHFALRFPGYPRIAR